MAKVDECPECGATMKAKTPEHEGATGYFYCEECLQRSKSLGQECGMLYGQVLGLQSENAALRSRAAVLEEALKPLKAYAEMMIHDRTDTGWNSIQADKAEEALEKYEDALSKEKP